MKKKTIGLFLAMLAVLVTAGCGKKAEETNSDGVESVEEVSEEAVQPDRKHVSVFLAGGEEENSHRREVFEQRLTEEGHDAFVFTASEGSAAQASKIKEELQAGAEVLVIEPVDAYGLSSVLAIAAEQEVPVIAYDTLIMDSEHVSYYTTYSYREMGHLAGEAIKKEKKLDEAAEKQLTYNVEFLMGSQDSLESLFFYNGVMEILKEYFDAGVLVCPSGKTSFDASGILRWDERQALLRFEEILGNVYQNGGAPDIICTGFDAAALSAVSVLEAAGFAPEGENWPMITGVGYSDKAQAAIDAGKMYGSIYMDEEVLMETCIKMADACADGEEPKINDSTQYDNGVKIIDANVCEAKLVTQKNADKLEETEIETENEDETKI